MTSTALLKLRHPFFREILIFLAFLILTLVMTWPWVLRLRDAVADPGDPYLHSWILWWDYHQTFHDPLNLFHANIFYPYRYSLAFSENEYGIALLFFPLFALGFRPLTVEGIATLTGFAFSGYGAFRLARTLTGSNGVAWVAGVGFAFVPYRFHQLSHLNYLFAGWIPVVLESLVLFMRERSWRRAVWLGLAFLMNALSCIHWFVLTLIPLGLSAVLLLFQYRLWKNWALWRRGGLALGVAVLALIPFLLPYQRVAHLYGFVRTPENALSYSALPIHWLVPDSRNKLWQGLNAPWEANEMALFPGLVLLLLAVAAFFLVERKTDHNAPLKRVFLVCLDLLVFVCALTAFLAAGYGVFRLRLFGSEILRASSPDRALFIGGVALFVRCCIAYPEAFRLTGETNIIATLRSVRRPEAFKIGLIWTVAGFLGSFGMNFPFHRLLYDFVPLFRSIRVPARWAMICDLGLALLAGLGAGRCAELFTRYRLHVRTVVVYVIVVLALLFEQRVAPLMLFAGAVDPDPLTLRLKQTPMQGGIVELPAGRGQSNHLYTLRAADHARPLVTAVSGFTPPIEGEIESLTHTRPIPERFFDLLEAIPASYLVINYSFLTVDDRLAIEPMLAQGIAAGRLRFIRSDGEPARHDLYAVTKIEPEAESEGPLPSLLSPADVEAYSTHVSPQPERGIPAPNPIDGAQFFVRRHYADFLDREPDSRGLDYWAAKITLCGDDTHCVDEQRVSVSAAFFTAQEFQETGYVVYRFYKGTLGRLPRYAEFMQDRKRVAGGENLESSRSSFAEAWVRRREFMSKYPTRMPPEQFIDALLKTMREASGVDLSGRRDEFISRVKAGVSRGSIVRDLLEDKSFAGAEYNAAFVFMQYFGYLRRDPDANGYAFWVDILNDRVPNNYRSMVRAFITSKEYRSRFGQP